jgi:hypothetical protein
VDQAASAATYRDVVIDAYSLQQEKAARSIILAMIQMNKSDSIAKLAEALAKAQGEVKAAVKNRMNPHFKFALQTHAASPAAWSMAETRSI